MPASSLSRWEKCGLLALGVLVLVFGGLVEMRSAFLSRRMGDVGVYLRAAWAVRAGEDLYAVTDNNHWHYIYPPLLAILMVPLADPPPDVDAAGYVPFPVAVAVWYLLNVGLLLLGVHWLASAIEKASPDSSMREQPPRGRRWWALRLLPILGCLTPIGHTLMRGQINLLVLVLLCGMIAELLRGRSLLAGLCLAGATCLKVIPAFLVIFLLWKRDRQGLAGFAMGLLVGLVLIPTAVFGPERTVAHYRTYQQRMLQPALVGGPDESLARELLAAEATASQSLVSTLHHLLYPDRETRPRFPPTWLKGTCWLIGLLLTGLLLHRARRQQTSRDHTLVLVLGTLTMIMLLLSPICHRHYFCLALPLVMAFLAGAWERRRFPATKMGWVLVVGFQFLAVSISQLPGCEGMAKLGLGTLAALILWLTAMFQLGGGSPSTLTNPTHEPGIAPPLACASGS